MAILTDTTENAGHVQIELLRKMSFAEKAARVQELTLAVQKLAFAELRGRHPGKTDDDLWLLLAARRLGRDTVLRVYGRDCGVE